MPRHGLLRALVSVVIECVNEEAVLPATDTRIVNEHRSEYEEHQPML